MTAPLVDQANRDTARSDFSRSIAIEAAAGTGKTEALSSRVVEAIVADHAAMPRIAAITFTRKAAGELQVRVRQRLSKELEKAVPGSQRHRRIHAGLQQLEQASMSTIHAFCEGLLRSEPFAVGLDPTFRVVEEIEAKLLLERVWEEWVHTQMQQPDSPLPVLLQQSAPKLKPRSAKSGPPFSAEYKSLKEDDIRKAVDTLLAIGDGPVIRPPTEPTKTFSERVEALSQYLQAALADAAFDASHVKNAADKLFSGIEQAKEAAERARSIADPLDRLWAMTSPPIPAGGGAKTKWRSEGELDAAKSAIAQVYEHWHDELSVLWPQAAALRAAPLWRQAYDLVADVVARYHQTKRAEALADFDDLLRLTATLLDDDTARAALTAQYDLLLVDECQDVDPVQLDIVLKLTGHGQPGEPSYEPIPGRLFYVGDPKQSIFRFRGADLDAYRQARDLVSKGDPPLQFGQNFRSVPVICDAVNAAFGPEMDGQGSQADYVPLTAHRAGRDEPGLVGIPLPHAWHDDETTQKVLAPAEAAAVASFLAALRDGSLPFPMHVQDPETGEWRPPRLADVTILMHRFGQRYYGNLTQLDRIEHALSALSVPFVTIGGKGYFSRDEVREFHTLLRCLDDPYDPEALVAALRGPACACTDAELLQWRMAGGSWLLTQPIEAEGKPARVVAAFGALQELRSHLRSRSSIRGAVESVLTHSGLLEVAAAQRRGEDAVANLLKVVELAAVAESAGLRTPRAFIRYLDGRIDEESAEEDLLLDAGRELDAVRIMTVHKAKGLSTRIAVLVDWLRSPKPMRGFDKARSQDGWFLRIGAIEPAGMDEAVPLEVERNLTEFARLGYVAATRARDWLVSVVMPPSCADKLTGPLLPLGRVFDPEVVVPDRAVDVMPGVTVQGWAVDETLDPQNLPEPHPDEVGKPARGDEDDALAAWSKQQSRVGSGGAPDWLHRAARSKALEDVTIPDSVVEVSQPPAWATRWPAPHDDRSDARGVLVHRLLEHADLAPLRGATDPLSAIQAIVEDLRPLAVGLARAQHWDETDADGLLGHAARMLSTPLMACVADARQVRHEVPFHLDLRTVDPTAPAVVVDGVIDLAFEDADGQWWVADFKTGSATPDRLVEKHGRQVRLYALALAQTMGTATVKTALISVVPEPNTAEE